MFLRCSVWRGLAEHVTESLGKGARVVATGRLRQFDWKTEQGENRSMLALEVDDIGPSPLFATATTTKAAANGGSQAQRDNPWNTAAPAAATNSGDKPPF